MTESKTTAAAKRTRPTGTRQHYSGAVKTQAVLSVWTEKRKPQEVCRELGIHWAQLRNWENRALDGMLTFLSPTPRQAELPALSKRVEQLLTRRTKALPAAMQTRLARRLESITTPPPEAAADKTEKTKMAR